jgi:hypothetical protein
MERAAVTIARKNLAVSVVLIALVITLSNPGSALLPLASAQARPGVQPGDITDIAYVYKGQKFGLRLYKGELLMVTKDNLPVVMYSRGTAHPISQDANTVAAAEEAVKAYKAGTPSGGAGSAPASTAGAAPGSGAAPASTLTVDGVISLLDAGLSDDIIITKIQKSGQAFDLSTDDMIRLKKAKASDAVMKAMMNATPAPAASPGSGPAASMSGPGLRGRDCTPGRLARRGVPTQRSSRESQYG